MNPSTQRGPVRQRGRERRVSVKLLVVAAVGVAAILMATLTAQAVVARTACNNHPLLINVGRVRRHLPGHFSASAGCSTGRVTR